MRFQCLRRHLAATLMILGLAGAGLTMEAASGSSPAQAGYVVTVGFGHPGYYGPRHWRPRHVRYVHPHHRVYRHRPVYYAAPRCAWRSRWVHTYHGPVRQRVRVCW